MSQYNYGTTYDLFDDTMNTVTVSAGGGSYNITGTGGGVLTTGIGGGAGLTWQDYTINTSYITNSPLKVNGDAEIDGDLKIKGKSIGEALDRIEERLAILHPNAELEEHWDELKELGKRYRELEKDIMEKEQIWKQLQK
jgi:hypothetical protein